MHAHEAI
jgi:uncharacterized UBP type Zn finger protein